MRIAITICVTSILSLCAIFLLAYKGTPQNAVPKITSAKQRTPTPQPQKQESQQSRTPVDFYQTIIDNNIFRPLNWKPVQQTPDYKLLGTTINTDNTHKTAYIIDTKSNQFHKVTTGDPIRDATVQNITAKRVTLNINKGELILTLNDNTFLNAKYNSQPRRNATSLPQQVNPQPQNVTQKNNNIPRDLRKDSLNKWREHYTKELESIRKTRQDMMGRLKDLEQR